MNNDLKPDFSRTQRFKIGVEYDGSGYCGFQKQFLPNFCSVEEVLTSAIFKFSGQQVQIFASGRTDAGVHAIEQTIHFDLKLNSTKNLSSYQIIMGLNHHLRGEKIAVKYCELVGDEFHARFSAKMRHYRYAILNRIAPPILEDGRLWHVGKCLNLEKMQLAAGFFLGEHDFSSFRDGECQAKSAIRTISKLLICREDEKILVEISAKSFLHHMVRNIVGTLVYVGLGKISAEAIPEILAAKNRQASGPNAPAYGLFFLKTDY